MKNKFRAPTKTEGDNHPVGEMTITFGSFKYPKPTVIDRESLPTPKGIRLSNVARAIAGVYFGRMGKASRLVFGMQKSKPTATTQKALDELVTKGVIAQDGPTKRNPKVEYRPLRDCWRYAQWLSRPENEKYGQFKLVEPI